MAWNFLLLSSLSFGRWHQKGQRAVKSPGIISIPIKGVPFAHNVRHIDLAVNLLHEERHLIRDLDVLRMVMDQTIFSALPSVPYRERGQCCFASDREPFLVLRHGLTCSAGIRHGDRP
ncbi:hypothetical protein KC323_g228 [Hortaea werneckii]|nr:hypothetical protein KC323_g228 [Hortaea werneckii]